MPAAVAGIKVGDRIVSVNGTPTKTFYDVLRIVRDRPDMSTEVVYQHDGVDKKVNLVPKKDTEKSYVYDSNLEMSGQMAIQGKLGILWDTHFVRLGFLEATRKAVVMPFKMVAGLALIAKEPSRAKNELGGPGTIAVIAVAAAAEGLTMILMLAAMLSISLGVMNLLPAPPLDGGQMVVAFCELLRGGRRLSMQVQQWVLTGGLVFVLALTAATLAVDVNRFVGKDEDAKPTVQTSRDGGTNPPIEEGKRK
jgi:regulator of sigma E protease